MPTARRGAMAALLLGGLAMAPSPRPLPDYRDGSIRQLASGRLLVATAEVQGPFFPRSVVLLLEYGRGEGALGVVVNRPSDVPLARVLPEPDLEGAPHRVWVGGPVDAARMTVLFRAAAAPALPEGESHPLVDGVHVGSTTGVLRALVQAGRGPQDWRAYVGYAGWAPGQLEEEVARGSWGIEEGASRWIFADNPEVVWPALHERAQGLRTRAPQRCATTYAIQAGSSGACARRVKTPFPSSVFASVPSQ